MEMRYVHWKCVGIAAVLATFAAGCATTKAPAKAAAPPAAAAQAETAARAEHGFVIAFQGACPTEARPFGPAGSECPDHRPACIVVPHGRPVRFERDPAVTSGEFVIDFTPKSPFPDQSMKNASHNGSFQKPTVTTGPKPDEFPFRVQAPKGSTCPNVDPEIILN